MGEYKFNSEEVAIASEQWLVDKAAELGMPFQGVTQRWAVPIEERLPLPDGASMGDLGEPTGKWVYPRIPQNIRDRMSQEDIQEFLTLFSPEITE